MFGKDAVKLITELDMYEDIRPFNVSILISSFAFKATIVLYISDLISTIGTNNATSFWRNADALWS